MVKYLEHRQLAARGLTCGKIRRRVTRGKFINALEAGVGMRIIIVLGTLSILLGMMFLGTDSVAPEQILIAFFLFIAALALLWMGNAEALRSNSRLALIFGTLLVQLALVKVLLPHLSHDNFYERVIPFLIPYAFAPLTLSALLGRNDGLFALFFGSLYGALLFNNFHSINTPFLILSLMTGLIAVIATLQVRRRSRLIRAGIYVGVATWVLALLFGEIGPISWSSFGTNNWFLILLQSAAALASGVGTAIIVSGLLPILEHLFRVTTDISWLEMADLNHPLLRRLSMEAPGTYQHSLAMATLAESAAEAIHANPTICRVGAYFHDIGKLVKPEYFTENMASGENPHDALTPTMSTLIISAHVKEGVDLALKNKLHRRVIDIIRQHHGTTMVGCFFQRACQQQEDARLGGQIMNIRPEDIPDVSAESFRYPGPRPQTKEAAIIGLADAAESAARSIERPTPQRIDDLVHALLEERLKDGQYNECPITMGELHKIADSLVNSLLGMLHTRIAYKKDKAQQAK